MPAARNQEVTVRRPVAKRMPTSSRGRRAAERLCSHRARAAKALVRKGGRWENGMAGSLTRDPLSKGHRVQGAGLRPPTGASHYPTARHHCPSCDLFGRENVEGFHAKYRRPLHVFVYDRGTEIHAHLLE